MITIQEVLADSLKQMEKRIGKNIEKFTLNDYTAFAIMSPATKEVRDRFIEELYKESLPTEGFRSITNIEVNEWNTFEEVFAFLLFALREDISNVFIESFSDFLDIRMLSRTIRLPVQLIAEYEDAVDWSEISTYGDLTEEFIERYEEKIFWGLLVKEQKVSEKILRKYMKRLESKTMFRLPATQDLSETFIAEYMEHLSMEYVSVGSNISYEFICDHMDKLVVDLLLHNENVRNNLTNEQLQELKEMEKLKSVF